MKIILQICEQNLPYFTRNIRPYYGSGSMSGVRRPSQTLSCGICGGPGGIATFFLPRISVLSSQYNLTKLPYYEDESIIIRSAVAFVFLLAALSFPRAPLDVVFFLSQLCRFEVARSVPLSQP